MQQYKAIKDIASRQVYSPYFKSRWQNMQNIVNDSEFIESLPQPYQTYYQAYIKQWLDWANGFVPSLHRGDFFSLGMGYTICDIFAKECMSGGFRLDSRNKAARRIMELWGNKLNEIFNEMFFHANAGGNAILCLTPIDGDLYPSVISINRIVMEVSRKGGITKATIFNQIVVGEKVLATKEQRVTIDGVSYYKVILSDGGTISCPSWNGSIINVVPMQAEAQWQNSFGSIKPNVWYKMPLGMRNIGLYNVRNKSVAVALSGLRGYSDSTLHTALDVLYSIDYNYTQQQLDQYYGKTRVIIPPRMQQKSINTSGVVNVSQGVSFVESIQQGPLDDIFSAVPSGNSVSDEPLKPFFMQPDLRGEAHKYIRDSDLEILASKVGLSSTTLANHLTYNNSKTATEVVSEQDTTETSVNNKRALADKSINDMLKTVAEFYGIKDEVTISWNRATVNSSTENQALLADYQAGTLPLREYLKRRWRDLTEEEIESWAVQIETKEKQNSFGFNDSNYFGVENEQNNTNDN